MANELTEHQQGLVSLVEGNELGDIIKPMIKEIPLFDSYIAGTTHLDDKTGLDKTKIGDVLSLQREDKCRFLVLSNKMKKGEYIFSVKCEYCSAQPAGDVHESPARDCKYR